ncbi:MAG: molybdenum cofactor guanylyltransferase [Candidatus Acidiferrum sp.]
MASEEWRVARARATAGYVLAGGASSRFGSDKALAEFGEKPMLARMLGLVDHAVSRKELACKAVVIGAAEKYGTVWTACVEDRWPGEGPLGGIVTALLHTRKNAPESEWNLIVGCDMPFLTADWLRFLAERAAGSAAQVVVPHSTNGPEPLCACWRTDAAEELQTAFERGVRRVNQGISHLRSEVLDERDWKRFDSAGRLFWNMNTAADYEEARRIVETEQR